MEESSKRIKDIRARTGLSQKKFAAKYEIPSRTIEDWETGKRVPPEYVVKLLERAVNEDLGQSGKMA